MNKHLRNIARKLSLAIAVVLCFLGASAQVTHAAGLADAVAGLTSNKFSARVKAVEKIAEQSDPRSSVILEALVTGNLYYRKSDKRVVIGTKNGPSSAIIDAVTGAPLGETQTRTLKKVRANNKLRGLIKTALGASRLRHADAAVRLAAAKQMLRGPTAKMRKSVANALRVETDSDVRETLEIVLAMTDVRSDATGEQMAAIERLGRSTRQEVRALLVTVAADDSDVEPAVKAAAVDALKRVEDRLEVYGYAQNLFFGLSLGSVLLLASVGLAITFGVMGVINMAHGEMVMLGAYTTFVVQQLMPNAIEYSLLVALPAAFLVAGGVGILIERGVIRFLYGRPLETLLATFGLSLILQQAVRSVFSPLNRSVTTPEWMSGSWALDPALSLTLNRVYIIVFALLVLGALVLLLRYSRFGLQVRAVTQNRQMARAMGIRTGRVDALTFGLGSGIAGLAGVALSQLTNVGPNMGQAYIVDSFMVVVFGGVGNLMGTFLGAMTLGVVNKFLEPATGAVLAKILVLVFIIVFIQRRPQGLFALRGRSAEA